MRRPPVIYRLDTCLNVRHTRDMTRTATHTVTGKSGLKVHLAGDGSYNGRPISVQACNGRSLIFPVRRGLDVEVNCAACRKALAAGRIIVEAGR